MMTPMAERKDVTFFADIGVSANFPKPATITDLIDALTLALKNDRILSPAKQPLTHESPKILADDTSNNRVINKNSRILLVEDNRINQVVILGILANFGLSADVAGNGLEALAALMSSPDDAPYKLIIMDCQMPEMDGYEATREIRAGKTKEFYNEIPIIAMTANAMKGDKEKCLIAGMSDYATKPVDPDTLYEKMMYWIGEQKENDSKEISKEYADNQQTVHKKNTDHDVNHIDDTLTEIVWDKTGFLKRVRNNNQLARKLIDIFVEDIPQVKDELCDALKNNELTDIASYAHKITGSASNLGGVSLAKLTKSIEQNANDSNVTEIEILIKSIEHKYQLFHDEISLFSEE